MPRPNRFLLAQTEILAFFSAGPKTIFSEDELAGVLFTNKHGWRLPDSAGLSKFIAFLGSHGQLQTHVFRSEAYGRDITRYSWGTPSPYAIAIALKPRGYLSHGSAAILHGLAAPDPGTLYLNVEQSQKPAPRGGLSQRGIDLAFSRRQRQSNLVYTKGTLSVVQLAGKHSERLGVDNLVGPEGEILAVTDLERTLIDIVVRPAYAGGPALVLAAYCDAKNRIDIDRLITTLKTLDYIYPYHQAIGFLMQQAGYPEGALAKLRALGIKHKFYIDYGMKDPIFNSEWRLYYPKDIHTLPIPKRRRRAGSS